MSSGGSLSGLGEIDSIEGLYSELPSIRPRSSTVCRPCRRAAQLDANFAAASILSGRSSCWRSSCAARSMARRSGAFDDPDNYLPLARSLAAGDGFVQRGRATAYRPPLYPLMLAPLVSKTGEVSFPGIALLHLGLGAGTVWLTAKAAARFGPLEGPGSISPRSSSRVIRFSCGRAGR